MAEVPMKDYAGNSKKQKQKEEPKEERKKLEPVVSGEVIVKERGIGSRVKSLFFGEDFRNVCRYVASEVLLPAARNMIVDMTTQGVQRAVWGESQRKQKAPQYQSHVSYNTPVTRSMTAPTPSYSPARPSSTRQSSAIILETRDQAELVVERMIDIIRQFEVVSVADLNELCNIESQYTDQKWGWFYLNNVQVRQVREGYLIDLPPAEAI